MKTKDEVITLLMTQRSKKRTVVPTSTVLSKKKLKMDVEDKY